MTGHTEECAKRDGSLEQAVDCTCGYDDFIRAEYAQKREEGHILEKFWYGRRLKT